VASKESQLEFPTSLSSHDRLRVHQLAEEFGLRHDSTGEGKARHITVSRRSPASSGSVAPQPSSPPSPAQAEPEPRAEEPVTVVQAHCPVQLDLKALHLERLQRQQSSQAQTAKGQPGGDSRPQKASQKKKKKEPKGKATSLRHISSAVWFLSPATCHLVTGRSSACPQSPAGAGREKAWHIY
jgi:ATP-dependent RNA/DNA helicase IGHMBP2